MVVAEKGYVSVPPDLHKALRHGSARLWNAGVGVLADKRGLVLSGEVDLEN